ncbi:MAG: FIST N-terminal domain-containing protein [Dehalococcoidia bacterium]
MRAAAAIAQQPTWQEALSEVLDRMPHLSEEKAKPDLTLLFASSDYAADFPQLVTEARTATGTPLLIGCSGQGVIGSAREIEGEPALALLALWLPQALLHPFHLSQRDLERCNRPQDWHQLTGLSPEDVNAWLVFADPFSLDAERLLVTFSEAYPTTPLVGGMASGDHSIRQTHLFLNDEVHESGAVVLALGGPYAVRAVVSQGCTPIGETWTITSARGHMIESIAQRPAYQVLVDTVRALPTEIQQRVQGNLFVGLAIDECREEYTRGDFLIRNLIGVDRDSGALAVTALPWVGQTLQFQIRDAAAADEELQHMLMTAKADFGGEQPIAALLCSCNGRGRGLFGAPDHDAHAVSEVMGPLPLAGFFCNGEIGPVGGRAFLHGFTASVALIVAKEPSGQGS